MIGIQSTQKLRVLNLLEGYGNEMAEKSKDQRASTAGSKTARFFNSRKNAELFERDYPAMLLSLASSIRTGLDPVIALGQVGELFPDDSLVKHELIKLKRAIDSGVREEEAIRAFGAEVAHPDIKLFTTAFLLARKEGSSLGECLQRLTKVTRHRQSFRRKSKAAIAMQRLSAIGIALCSVLIGGMQVASNPKAFAAAWAHPFGFNAIVFGALLLGSGLLWMFRIGRSKI